MFCIIAILSSCKAEVPEPNTYTINYELDGGTNAPDNHTSYTIETETVTLKSPTKDGYTFSGWFETEDFNGNTVTGWKAGEKTEDVTLYAKWTAIVYPITYELDGGTNATGNPENYTIETETVAFKDPTKAGFTFVCWYSDRSKKTEITKGSIGDIVLQAVWKDNKTNFVKVPAVSINGSESWTPESEVFVSGRELEIKAFWMSDHEVTQAEWKEVMDGNLPENMASTDGTADNNPVNYVSWYDAIVYCNKRSIKEGLIPCYTIKGSTDPDKWGDVPPTSSDTTWDAATCNFDANGYRLPTEAEWEWAARGGENYKCAGSDDINEVAWWFDNTEGSGTREVKSKMANGYGLYDMSGNVEEWCWDWGRFSRTMCVHRGGSWLRFDGNCEIDNGGAGSPNLRQDIGLRVVRSVQ